MIRKREILDRKEITKLNSHIIEKDYALGWLLAGISSHKEIGNQWVFKGGTCLKKCYFETYRFSEDLDFTLKKESHLDRQFLKNVFAEISEWVYQKTRFEFPYNLQDFDIYESPQGRLHCQGKLSYQGPVSPRTGGLPRIKLDLTADEKVILPPVQKQVSHPYSDCPEEGIKTTAYVYEETFAEKIRALSERANPRDLYDVINLYRNAEAYPNVSNLKESLKRKCEFKGVPVPKLGDILKHKSKLKGAWHEMIAHQLPYLPPFDSFLQVLSEFFKWLEGRKSSEEKTACRFKEGEVLVKEQTAFLPLKQKIKSYIELIRFASANRLCVNIKYQDSIYKVECYSLRKIKEGHFILYAWDVDKNILCSYAVHHIQDVEIISDSFTSRYLVELTPRIL